MLSTIGYEGITLDALIRELKNSNINVLIDVRERAQSRRQGFSKTALSEALRSAGVKYLHYRELGDPKEGRDAARAGNFKEFRRIYQNVLRRNTARAAMAEVVKIIDSKNVCLLCYERDEMTCHRKIISDKIQEKTGIKIKHLRVQEIEPSQSSNRRMLHSSEGAAASI